VPSGRQAFAVQYAFGMASRSAAPPEVIPYALTRRHIRTAQGECPIILKPFISGDADIR